MKLVREPAGLTYHPEQSGFDSISTDFEWNVYSDGGEQMNCADEIVEFEITQGQCIAITKSGQRFLIDAILR